jgi:hypothetical protein
MAETIENIQFKVHRTIKRHDDNGEFIIRLTPRAIQLFPRRCQYVVVQSVGGELIAEDGTHRSPEVIAAVRSLARDDKLAATDDISFCQLDMSLRVAVGVIGYDPKNGNPLANVTGRAGFVKIAPLRKRDGADRNIQPSWTASWIKFQWMLFRVQHALTGDFETPICRVRGCYLASLGIEDRGVVVVESVHGQVTRRLLAADDDLRSAAESDFEKQLGIDDDLKMPSIYMDHATRDQLGVIPGQTVWVRRQLGSIFRREVLKIASALALAFIGIAFSVPVHWTIILLIAMVVALLACAIIECRDAVRADEEIL